LESEAAFKAGGLLWGAPAYRARTPWRPGWAVIAAAFITVAGILAAIAFVGVANLSGPAGAGESPAAQGHVALTTLGVWQAVTIALTLLASALFGGRARDVLALGAPLAEELLFRGFLLSALARTRAGFAGAALISTSLWTALHAGYSLIGIVEVFTIGLFFSWMLWRTGSLRVPIFCHALYNSLLVCMLRFVALPGTPVG
jgi:Type II CAAX prenyl endopeptidase Rce1-like